MAFSIRKLGQALKDGFWALMIPVVIWGGIFGGIATATEAGGMPALAAIVIGVFIYRELTWRDFWKTIIDSSMQTAVIMLIVATSAVLGWYLTNEGIPQQLAQAMLGLTRTSIWSYSCLTSPFSWPGASCTAWRRSS